MDFLLKHKIIILLVGVGVAGLAWFGMTSSGSTALLVSDSPASAPDQELVETLLALRSVKLDGTIFTEPSFVSLQDYSQPIIQEPVGRDNPFAPLDAAAPNNNPVEANQSSLTNTAGAAASQTPPEKKPPTKKK